MNINYIKKNGIHTCDYEIPINQWLTLFQNETIFTKERFKVLGLFYNELNHKSSCYDLAKKYFGIKEFDYLENVTKLAQSFNAFITGLGRSISKKLNINCGTQGHSYYILVMNGKYITNENGKHFEWTLLPNLVNALDIYFNNLNNEFISIVEETIIDSETHTEGKKISYYTSKYERNTINRDKAKKIHGYNCAVCGFNFEKVYGNLGKDYIEVHHIKPLSTLNEEVKINPKTDLICVCANCHRMLHRKKSEILTVEQLKDILKKESE